MNPPVPGSILHVFCNSNNSFMDPQVWFGCNFVANHSFNPKTPPPNPPKLQHVCLHCRVHLCASLCESLSRTHWPSDWLTDWLIVWAAELTAMVWSLLGGGASGKIQGAGHAVSRGSINTCKCVSRPHGFHFSLPPSLSSFCLNKLKPKPN